MAKDEWKKTPLRFKRKVNSVEAVQVTEDNVFDLARWCGGIADVNTRSLYSHENKLIYPTLEGSKYAMYGVWLIKDESGRFSTLSDEEFKERFEYVKSSVWTNL